MLRIIKGAVNSRRDAEFCQSVREAAQQGRKVLVIMPDQYSFECDKKLYQALGAKTFNRITTAGVNRLAELVSREYGSCAFENADENIRLITMFKALERFKAEKDCRFYKRSLAKGRFAGEMLELCAQLIRSGITPEDLRVASEKLRGSLTLKLYDISRIFANYLEALSEAGLRDSLTALADAVKLMKEHDYFRGTSVFFDGFTDLTGDELAMIDCMLAQRADITFSLLLRSPGESFNPDYPFAATLRTCSDLSRLAQAHNTRIDEEELPELCGAKDTILAIDRWFCTGRTSSADDPSGLTLANANDIYDELEYVCAETERLVREEGYSYSEIAVASRETGVAFSAAESAFERYAIPYFSDRSLSADSSILVIFLKNIFECVLPQKYRTDDILRLVRSPLFPLNDIEVTTLEEHCITYSVNGDMWLSPFTAHDSRHSVPSNLEEIRQRIILPLEKFKSACQDTSAENLCKELFELLETYKTSEQVYSVVMRSYGSDDESQLEFARANRRLWQSVFGAVKSIHDELGEEKLSLRRFFELFKLMTSRIRLASPPQKLDAVRLVNAESSRLDNVRALFVIEANERVFPADPQSGGLFTENEKQQLISAELAFSGTALHSAENERLVVYRTLCLPKDRLCVIYSETDTAGKSKRRSVLIDKLSALFCKKELLHISKLPLSFFCTSYRTAYYKYLEHLKEKLVAVDNTGENGEDKSALIKERLSNADNVAAVERALRSSPEYASRLDALPGYAYDQSFSVTAKTAKELFFSDKLTLSPTGINTFYTCPFSYFFKNGLRLREPHPFTFDSAVQGNYLHRTLEYLMSKKTDGKTEYDKTFVFLTDEQLKEKISIAFNKYESEELGGSYGKTPSFAAERGKYEEEVFHIVKLVQEEFSKSQFEPLYFEYKLGLDDSGTTLDLKLSDELTVRITGSIDRADVFTDEQGRKFLRIVDYKTGKTTFDLEKLYHGLNLQLLTYLLAMTSGESFEPAAVMYSHTKLPECSLDPPAPGKVGDIHALRLKEYKPDGLIVDSTDVVKAFNTAYGGAFLPVRLKQDGGFYSTGRQPVTESFLKASEEFARRKIIDLAKRLSEGKVPADPVMYGKFNPCTKCESYAACGRVLHGDPRTVEKDDKEKFCKEIELIEKEMKGGSNNA
ncbi:MAG: PD-(D/E)XK nuclease family protein [Ruminococcus sp.]|nr:PD-(D/E)XK nuclease family protein [Ruminococcus sp.]